MLYDYAHSIHFNKMAERSSATNAARETLDTLSEISRLLNTGLDPETLAICVKLCEAGVNPEALSSVIQELRREAAALKASQTTTTR